MAHLEVDGQQQGLQLLARATSRSRSRPRRRRTTGRRRASRCRPRAEVTVPLNAVSKPASTSADGIAHLPGVDAVGGEGEGARRRRRSPSWRPRWRCRSRSPRPARHRSRRVRRARPGRPGRRAGCGRGAVHGSSWWARPVCSPAWRWDGTASTVPVGHGPIVRPPPPRRAADPAQAGILPSMSLSSRDDGRAGRAGRAPPTPGSRAPAARRRSTRSVSSRAGGHEPPPAQRPRRGASCRRASPGRLEPGERGLRRVEEGGHPGDLHARDRGRGARQEVLRGVEQRQRAGHRTEQLLDLPARLARSRR